MARFLVFLTTGALLALLSTAAAAQECCGDCSGDGAVTVDEIVTAVGLALDGCPIVR